MNLIERYLHEVGKLPSRKKQGGYPGRDYALTCQTHLTNV